MTSGLAWRCVSSVITVWSLANRGRGNIRCGKSHERPRLSWPCIGNSLSTHAKPDGARRRERLADMRFVSLDHFPGARDSSVCGIPRTSAFVVFKFITNSNFVGSSTGRSARVFLPLWLRERELSRPMGRQGMGSAPNRCGQSGDRVLCSARHR